MMDHKGIINGRPDSSQQKVNGKPGADEKSNYNNSLPYDLRIEPYNKTGDLALYEYKNGLLLEEKTWKTSEKRNYYKTGDLILVGKIDLGLFSRIWPMNFPELQEAFPPKDALTLLANLFGSKQAIGHIIKEIKRSNNDFLGFGTCELQHILIFGEDPVPIGEKKIWHLDDLRDSCAERRLHRYVNEITLIARIVQDLSIGLVRAGVGKILSAAFFPTLRQRFMRKAIMGSLLRIIKFKTAKASFGAGKAFIKTFVQTYVIIKEEEKIQATAKAQKPDQRISKAHVLALEKAIASLIQSLLDSAEGLNLEQFENSQKKIQKNSSLQTWIIDYIKKRIIVNIPKNLISKIVDDLSKATEKCIKEGRNINEFINIYISNIDILVTLDNFFKEEIIAAINEVFSKPILG